MLFTNKKVSPKGSVNTADLKDWAHGFLKYFVVPSVVFYLGQLTGSLQDHQALLLSDLVPTVATQGAIEALALAQALSFLGKFANGAV